jgi:uncharacterized protein YkwD
MACAIVFAASSIVGSDLPVLTVAKNPPRDARVVIAMPSPPPAKPAAEPIITPPTVAGITNPPPDSAANTPAVTDAQEPPVAARTVSPAEADMPHPASDKLAVVTAAKKLPTDTTSAPAVAATADAPPAVATNPPIADTEEAAPAFDRRILAAHNRERQDLGLTPLSWNPALAQSAQRWADHLAQTGRFEHAPENHLAPEGENLWAGTKGYYTPEAMVGAWIREKRFFRPGTFPDNSITGRVEDIGHYTQVVWRATREVGCAEATSAAEDILVCRYAEAGNYRGEQPF